MATTKNNTRSRATGSNGIRGSGNTGRSRSPSTSDDKSIVARTGRTIKQQPYTSAAIATGAVTAVVAAAAGAFFFSRRDQSNVGNGETMTDKVKGTFAEARARVKDLVGSDGSSQQSDGRSQREIAEEALTLKETGGASAGSTEGTFDATSTSEIKTGAIAY